MYFIMCCWAVIYIFIAVQIKSAIDIHALKGLHLKDDQYSCALGSLKFYLLSAFGGLLSCGLTHTAMVPLDLIKCRMQANPLRYTTLVQSFRLALADDGIRSLTKGWVATFIGYCLQGTAKFGFYEVFKDVYSHLLGQYTTDIQNTERAPVIPHALYFLCDICLFPWFATCVHNSFQYAGAESDRYIQPMINLLFDL